jgi:hypothetical protein
MLDGVLGQLIQDGAKHRLSGTFTHGTVQRVDQIDQPVMLLVDGVDVEPDAVVPRDQLRVAG